MKTVILEECLLLAFFKIGSSDVDKLFFSQHSYHYMKAAAKMATKILLTAPSHSLLKVSWMRVRSASSIFTLGNRKKLVGARSSK